MGKMLTLQVGGHTFPAYEATPTKPAKGGVVVIHEVWALNEHIKSIADRFAAEGYYALAPDLLSETDVASHAAELQLDLFNPEKRNEAQPKLRALMTPMQEPGFATETLAKLGICFGRLYNEPSVKQCVAVCGFCFGGSYSYSMALHEPRLKAAIPFYGHVSTDKDELKKITCPILAFYGERDEGLVAGLPSVETGMEAAGVQYEAVVYPDCGHAFFNDTNPFAYNATAAKDAWQRTIAFLAAHR